MKKYFLIPFLFFCKSIFAQDDNYKNGYALKGKDTIWCKVQFISKYESDAKGSVTLIINNDESTFFPGGPITGFGAEDNGKKYNYGLVDVEFSVGNQLRTNKLFIKKLVAGAIDLYEYSYTIRTTKTKSINGEKQPGSETTSQNFSINYISKADSARPVLAKPIVLPSFRKKDLEPYLSDNPAIMARAEKRFSMKELIDVINEYNKWYLERLNKKNDK